MLKKLFAIVAVSAITTVAYASSAQAAAFKSITIGDKDGFGYGVGEDYSGAYGGAANIDGRGVLGVGDLLPDLNQDGKLATGKGDDFDKRSVAEKGNNYITGRGFVDNGSSGSKFTDISLSTSLIKKNKKKNNYNLEDKGFTQDDVKNSKVPLPVFNFDFFVAENGIKQGSDMYLNMLFGDYDVKDAKIEFTKANGDTFIRELTKQKNAQGQDGLIQSAFVELDFGDIFTATDTGYDGSLQARVIAEKEPYLTFDFAELSTKKISLAATQDIPEPTSILGFIAFGTYGAGSLFKRKKKA